MKNREHTVYASLLMFGAGVILNELMHTVVPEIMQYDPIIPVGTDIQAVVLTACIALYSALAYTHTKKVNNS